MARSTWGVQRHVDSKWAATLHVPVLLNPPFTTGGIAPAVPRRCSLMPWGNCLIVSCTDLSLAAPWGKACWHIHIISFVDPSWGPEESNISFTFLIVVLNLWEGEKKQNNPKHPMGRCFRFMKSPRLWNQIWLKLMLTLLKKPIWWHSISLSPQITLGRDTCQTFNVWSDEREISICFEAAAAAAAARNVKCEKQQGGRRAPSPRQVSAAYKHQPSSQTWATCPLCSTLEPPAGAAAPLGPGGARDTSTPVPAPWLRSRKALKWWQRLHCREAG